MMKLILLATSCSVLAQLAMMPEGFGNAIPKDMKDGFINNAMNGSPKNEMPNANVGKGMADQKPPAAQPDQKPSPPEQQLEQNEGPMKVIPASIQNLLVSQVESQRAVKQTKSDEESSKPTESSQRSSAKATSAAPKAK
ncbi:hypothetical protein DSO57_1023790 [Entomophthora muscae]|uniref:Uncharacterized protein n=2 Tax=Entomophthora muscae TaxID=34485 RepID=A0ACC2RGA1_9FUNG|nr:hypothetical protein DSO57_1028124 [Entomophthora muscae]KAJ9065050.1 hypothetical protein DSO57_1023790 [Entomophthora muscae]